MHTVRSMLKNWEHTSTRVDLEINSNYTCKVPTIKAAKKSAELCNFRVWLCPVVATLSFDLDSIRQRSLLLLGPKKQVVPIYSDGMIKQQRRVWQEWQSIKTIWGEIEKERREEKCGMIKKSFSLRCYGKTHASTLQITMSLWNKYGRNVM